MNLDINYFCTYDEQKDLLNHLINNNSLVVYLCDIKDNKNDFFIQSFDEELKKTIRKVNYHYSYLFNIDDNVVPRELVIEDEEITKYALGPSEVNCNGIDVKTCSYEKNMILFGRISTIFINNTKIEIFKDLKKYMRGKFKKKGMWYISNTIWNNSAEYRLITVAANLQPKNYDLKL